MWENNYTFFVFYQTNMYKCVSKTALQYSSLSPQTGMSQRSMRTPSSSVKHQGASCLFPGLRQYECPPFSSG